MALDKLREQARTKYEEVSGKIADDDWTALVKDLNTEEDWTKFIGEIKPAATTGDAQKDEMIAKLNAKIEEMAAELAEMKKAPEDKPAPKQDADFSNIVDTLQKEVVALRQEVQDAKKREGEAKIESAEANIRQELAATVLDGNMRWAPSAIDLLTETRLRPSAAASEAMQTHMIEHGGKMATVPIVDDGALMASLDDNGDDNGEAWLASYPVAEDTKIAVRRLARAQKIGYREAYEMVIQNMSR